NCISGQEQACVPGVAGTEGCNERDDDCDGTVDDGFDKASVQFCGSCSPNCSGGNGTPPRAGRGASARAPCRAPRPPRAAGSAAVASCRAPFADCSAGYVDGCETDTSTSLAHCGGCNNLCTAANAASFCDAGACQYHCLPGFGDVDLDPTNGCEQGCVATD